MKRPRRIAVDWDGTCIEDNHWPEMGGWLPGAKEALYALAHEYDEVVIWTCRTAPVDTDERTARDPEEQIWAITRMLEDARMPLNVFVWEHDWKPLAEAYIDNRAIVFNGDWQQVMSSITNHQENQMEPRFEHDGPTILGVESELHLRPTLCAPSIHSDPGDEHQGGMRVFETGATRNAETYPDYHGFFSPLSMHAYGEYMHTHRLQADGSLRDSDNWQRGMPVDSYVRSLVRHTHDVQLIHDGYEQLARGDVRDPDKLKAHLAAIIFNAQGMLHELVKAELQEAA